MSAERAGTVSRSPKVAISAPSPELVFSMAREAYSREDICEAFNIPGDIEDEQDVVRLVAITLHGDPENMDCVEETLQERFWIDFPDGYPPLPLPVEIEEESGSPIASVLVEENPAENSQKRKVEIPEPQTELSQTPQVCLDEAPEVPAKNTDYTPRLQKTRTTPLQKTRTTPSQKTRRDYIPVSLWAVWEGCEVEVLLKKAGQEVWSSAVRAGGLLCLMDYIIRNHGSNRVRISADLAQEFVSELSRPKAKDRTIRQPLAVLEKIGFLQKVRSHIFGVHVHDCAIYRIPPRLLQKKTRRVVHLSPGKARKFSNAQAKAERRLNKKWLWRGHLVRDLGRLSLSDAGQKAALKLFQNKQKNAATRRVLDFLDGKEKAIAGADPFGTIRHNLNSCPKELKPELLIAGERIAICDISHAHHCLLPMLIIDRIRHNRIHPGEILTLDHLEEELTSLREFLSTGDYYSKWCVDSFSKSERAEKKLLLNMLLNWPNKRAEGNRLYRRMRSTFPFTFGILEDIKRNNHKNISPQLMKYTSMVINQALVAVQKQDIPAIPDTDALICSAEAHEVACESIGRAMYELSGVRCKVGGIRYQPPANGQHAAA
jgi:hypothetical protein